MKKFLILFAAVTILFVGCKKDTPVDASTFVGQWAMWSALNKVENKWLWMCEVDISKINDTTVQVYGFREKAMKGTLSYDNEKGALLTIIDWEQSGTWYFWPKENGDLTAYWLVKGEKREFELRK